LKNLEYAAFTLALVDTGCWVVCFWWMHRISARQDAVLNELHAVTRRTEEIAKQEHALIREVHPVVEKIHESVENVKDAVAEEQPARK
jgi:hypothetical protein